MYSVSYACSHFARLLRGKGTISLEFITTVLFSENCTCWMPSKEIETVMLVKSEALLQLDAHHRECRHQAVGPHLVQDYSAFVRLLACLIQEIGLAKFDQRAFGTCSHQCARRTDQHTPWLGTWTGNVDRFCRASLQTLENLFTSPSSSNRQE